MEAARAIQSCLRHSRLFSARHPASKLAGYFQRSLRYPLLPPLGWQQSQMASSNHSEYPGSTGKYPAHSVSPGFNFIPASARRPSRSASVLAFPPQWEEPGKTSRPCLMSVTPRPGQSAPHSVLGATSSRPHDKISVAADPASLACSSTNLRRASRCFARKCASARSPQARTK